MCFSKIFYHKAWRLLVHGTSRLCGGSSSATINNVSDAEFAMHARATWPRCRVIAVFWFEIIIMTCIALHRHSNRNRAAEHYHAHQVDICDVNMTHSARAVCEVWKDTIELVIMRISWGTRFVKHLIKSTLKVQSLGTYRPTTCQGAHKVIHLKIARPRHQNHSTFNKNPP